MRHCQQQINPKESKCHIYMSYIVRNIGGGGPVQICEARLCCICFCLSRWYRYLSVVGINPYRPNLSHSSTDNQSYRFSVRFLSGPPLLWGGGGSKNFYGDGKPFSAVLHNVAYYHVFPYSIYKSQANFCS